MEEELVKSVTITLYPSQIAKVERIMLAQRIRKFAQAIQRLVDEAPEPQSVNEAGQAAVARP
jgi:hypothetical protein